jgi:hypothetical protein
MAALLGAGALLCLGHWSVFWPPHHSSNWRAAVQTINRQTSGTETPVICVSPFIEARSPAWYPEYPPGGFLYAHLQVYPVAGKPYLFPLAVSPQAERFAAGISKTALASAHRFFVYGMVRDVSLWERWFHNRPELAGWTSQRLGSFGDVDVAEFTAAAAR